MSVFYRLLMRVIHRHAWHHGRDCEWCGAFRYNDRPAHQIGNFWRPRKRSATTYL